MKKLHSILAVVGLLLAVALTGIGCSGNSSPSKVAKQFYAVVEKGDTKNYSKVMTPGMAQDMAMFGEKAKAMLAAKNGIASMNETIDGDKATVEVKFKDGSTSNVELVKLDGKWKVTYS